MKRIIALTDYRNRFGSKHFDEPYRSGMDKEKLKEIFSKHGYEIDFIQFTDLVNDHKVDNGAFYVYTSSEDINYQYKSFIEDVVWFLESSGCNVIPKFKYLRANNNKVFMELLRNGMKDTGLRARVFGTKEEAIRKIGGVRYPVVVKTAEGAGGSGVYKADNEDEYFKIIDNVSNSRNLKDDLWDIGRSFKHKGYVKESRNRRKFITQDFIPSLQNDWKVLRFGELAYVFYRPVLKHRGFRASGGGCDNYSYGTEARLPGGLLDFSQSVFAQLSVPHASFDIAYDGNRFYLLEFQLLYFGTVGIAYSKGYFSKGDDKWQFIERKLSVEEVYAKCIADYISCA